MKHRVFIENTQQEKAPFRGYKTAVRRAVSKVLEEEGFEGKAEVSVTLVSAEEIRELNKAWRGVDRPTDVLSFPLEEEALFCERVTCLGDVIVCPAVIAAQSAEFGTTYRQEFCLMVIHSVLHLLGWDHAEENEKKEMFEKQEKILRSLDEGAVKTEE
ncbi:MAG: rRNA maturation RNase YbeY [Ruminococcaceae bacterium]|nr:rRNA maturation RNase YbeY [Oscillospiraceae bacterium]